MSPSMPAYYKTTQGYIVVTHGRKHVLCAMLLLLEGDRRQQWRTLSQLGSDATSAEKLFENKQKKLKSDPAVVTAVGLSASGFQKLGRPTDNFTGAFRAGFTTRFPDIGAAAEFDAIILLASDDEPRLEGKQIEVRNGFGSSVSIYWEY